MTPSPAFWTRGCFLPERSSLSRVDKPGPRACRRWALSWYVQYHQDNIVQGRSWRSSPRAKPTRQRRKRARRARAGRPPLLLATTEGSSAHLAARIVPLRRVDPHPEGWCSHLFWKTKAPPTVWFSVEDCPARASQGVGPTYRPAPDVLRQDHSFERRGVVRVFGRKSHTLNHSDTIERRVVLAMEPAVG